MAKAKYHPATHTQEKFKTSTEENFRLAIKFMTLVSYFNGKNVSHAKTVASGGKTKDRTTMMNPSSIVSGMIGKTKRFANGEITDSF